MTTPIDSTQMKYQVKVNGRIIGEVSSRIEANVMLSMLAESDKSHAEIVVIEANGNQVLLG